MIYRGRVLKPKSRRPLGDTVPSFQAGWQNAGDVGLLVISQETNSALPTQQNQPRFAPLAIKGMVWRWWGYYEKQQASNLQWCHPALDWKAAPKCKTTRAVPCCFPSSPCDPTPLPPRSISALAGPGVREMCRLLIEIEGAPQRPRPGLLFGPRLRTARCPS